MYDVCIIGGGPGGYVAAIRAAKAGLKTILAEKAALGGVCLNEGCIPSKTFLNTAKIVDHAKEGRSFAFDCEGATVDQAKLVKRKNKIVKKLTAGVKMSVSDAGAEIVIAEAKILSRDEDGNFNIALGDNEIKAAKVILATGSSPVIIPFTGIDAAMEKGLILTNKEILDLKEIPAELAVIGGGVIGLEMACYYAIAGSKVSVIEMLDHIAGETERELGEILQKNLEKLGIVFELSCKVGAIEAVQAEDGTDKAEVSYEKPDGSIEKICVDKVLLSVGRRPNSAGLGLEELGVKIERSAVVTNEKQETGVPGLYAIGDLTGAIMLAHSASREAEVAVNNILGKDDCRDDSTVPSVIYSIPEVAGCGLTAQQCEEKALDYKEVRLPLSYSGRYQAETERGDGVLKLLISDNKVVGCHVLGNYASEFIVVAAMLIMSKMTLDEIKKIVFPHPTVGEIIREAIFAAEE